MEVFENEVEVIPYVEHGELLVLWQLHHEGLGNAVTITTGKPVPRSCNFQGTPHFGHTFFIVFGQVCARQFTLCGRDTVRDIPNAAVELLFKAACSLNPRHNAVFTQLTL